MQIYSHCLSLAELMVYMVGGEKHEEICCYLEGESTLIKMAGNCASDFFYLSLVELYCVSFSLKTCPMMSFFSACILKYSYSEG